jgi:hypothetical protein
VGKRLGGAALEIAAQFEQSGLSSLCDFARGAISGQPLLFCVGIAWDAARDALSPSKVPTQRGGLRKRQLKALPNFAGDNPNYDECDDDLYRLQCIKGIFVHGASHLKLLFMKIG